MEGSNSPLQSINEKELEVRRRIREVRQEVEAKIRAAGEEAKQLLDQVEREVKHETKVLYDRGIEQAQQGAESRMAAARQEVEALRHDLSSRFQSAVEQVLTLILPARSASRQNQEMPTLAEESRSK